MYLMKGNLKLLQLYGNEDWFIVVRIPRIKIVSAAEGTTPPCQAVTSAHDLVPTKFVTEYIVAILY